ncbi:unnamed protein product [Kuraishia capsulata CBS 1993]|uniref:Uncharacterized protein n=1 Tax=Kuraishia capsulata CBS 1993 TaxID=1382522 RepID=W6MHF5_9ASCO|nr:uncharacterized protein KUCA_T00001376001 [Kuraishia capsulata CBS 1993]CDK25406.1 unnamed protein product [Kuraishia capsulata CBS 1993]
MAFKKFDISGRTALVTGGGRGIGLACALGLIEAGCNVGIFDVIENTANIEQLQKDHGVKIVHYIVDISDPEKLDEGFKQFSKDFGGNLDICVPCAGINKNLEFLNTTYEQFDHLNSINFRGSYFTAQLAAKLMIKNKTEKGSIVFICSMGSYIAIRSQRSSAYCGTKGGVRSMVAPIAAELHKYGIRANSISPGYVKTAMTECFPDLVRDWGSETMNGRVADPEDIAGTCVFLASDASSYLVGEDIVVDAGVTKW